MGRKNYDFGLSSIKKHIKMRGKKNLPGNCHNVRGRILWHVPPSHEMRKKCAEHECHMRGRNLSSVNKTKGKFLDPRNEPKMRGTKIAPNMIAT